MKKLDQRVAGYRAGIMASGEFVRSRVIGLIKGDNLVLKKSVKLNEKDYLFRFTQDDINKMESGELQQ